MIEVTVTYVVDPEHLGTDKESWASRMVAEVEGNVQNSEVGLAEPVIEVDASKWLIANAVAINPKTGFPVSKKRSKR